MIKSKFPSQNKISINESRTEKGAENIFKSFSKVKSRKRNFFEKDDSRVISKIMEESVCEGSGMDLTLLKSRRVSNNHSDCEEEGRSFKDLSQRTLDRFSSNQMR